MNVSLWLWPALVIAWKYGWLRMYIMALGAISLHELAHGLIAVLFRADISEFRLGPAGALLVLNEPIPKQVPMAVLHMAGPVFNVILAVGCLAMFQLSVRQGGTFEVNRELWRDGCLINCYLAVFNLLPVYPLDGGKILLSILEKSQGQVRAFQKIYLFSSIFSIFIFFLGIYLVQYQIVNFFLCILAFRCMKQLRTDRQYMVMQRVIRAQTSNKRKVE